MTDHKTLTTILGSNQSIPTLAGALLCWAVVLAADTYQIEFHPTGEQANADGLSQLPLKEVTQKGCSSEPIFLRSLSWRVCWLPQSSYEQLHALTVFLKSFFTQRKDDKSS